MSQQDKGKQSKNNSRVIKCVQNIHNRITKCLKIKKAKHQIISNILSHGCIILVIIARWKMVLETLLDVQLALLYTEVNRVNLLLHRTHAPCRDANAAKI
jgi:glycyl-tRNA synthetase beta subunit